MRKNSWSLLFVAAMFVFSGCGDDESGPTFASSPEARSENDASGKGVYKGVFIGSSGFVKVNVDNSGDGSISLTLNIDGESYNLTTDQTYNPEYGFEGMFSGLVDGSTATIGFYTNADGTSYGVFNINIPGHPNACIQVVKEKSNALVRCFEGSYSGSQSGILNFVLYGNSRWEAISRETGGTSCDDIEGTINGNNLVCNCDFDGDGTPDVDFTGTISGNNLSGTWSSSAGSGTWSATRIF